MAPGSAGQGEPDELEIDVGALRDTGVVAPVSAAAYIPVLNYTEDDLPRTTKLYRHSFIQTRAQANRSDQARRERPLKAVFPHLYSGRSHLECYNFCRQCQDHFDITGVTGFHRTHLAASFLCGRISKRWHQHKRRSLVDRPISWVDFKAFLRGDLGDSRAFVDSIWSRIKRESQYQGEEVPDWASHLVHFQAIIKEFDPDRAPEKSDLIRFFWKGLKPSVKAHMEPHARGLDSWEELVEQAIGAEVNAALQPSPILREIDMDHRCPRGNRPTGTTVAKARALLDWDPRDESADQRSSTTGAHSTSKKPRRERKKKLRQAQGPGRNSGTPATGVSMTNASGGRKDLSHIACFKCSQTGHHATHCLQTQKGRDVSEDWRLQ